MSGDNGGNGARTRVLIADDQEMVRTGFRLILGTQPDLEVIGEAADGAECVELARRMRPDVCLVDIRMPRLDGLEVTRALAGPGVTDPMRVVVVTTFDQDDYAYTALRNGACGFLLKDAGSTLLIEAVRCAARGDALVSPPSPSGSSSTSPDSSRRRRSRTRSPSGNSRSHAWWRWAAPTRRSAASCTSPWAPSRPTWPTSRTSSACATASRSPPGPGKPVSYTTARRPPPDVEVGLQADAPARCRPADRSTGAVRRSPLR